MEKKLPERLEQIVASFATAQPLRLMFQDEARFGRISDTRYCWAKRPMRPMVQAMLTHQYSYAYARGEPRRRPPRQSDLAAGQRPVHAIVYRRDRGSVSHREHRHDSRRCGLA